MHHSGQRNKSTSIEVGDTAYQIQKSVHVFTSACMGSCLNFNHIWLCTLSLPATLVESIKLANSPKHVCILWLAGELDSELHNIL